MLKRFLLVFLMVPATVLAQNKVADSLLKLLPTATADTQRIALYNKVADACINAEALKGMVYANKALALSRRINYKSGEGDALFNRGQMFINTLKSDSARADFEAAIVIYKSIKNLNGLAKVYNEVGRLLRTQGHTADAGVYFQQAADMFEKINNLDGSADCLVLLANNYNLMNLFDKALAMYQKCYALRIKIDKQVKAAQALAGIGITYRNKQQYDTTHRNNFKLAIYYMLKARNIFINYNHRLNIALIDKETGVTYLYQNDFKNALYYLLDAEARFARLDYKRELGSLYIGIGRSYVNLQQYAKGKAYLDKGMAAASAERYQQYIAEANRGYYLYYKAIGDNKTGLYYHEKWMDEKDSIARLFNFNKLSELTTRYETEKKEQQIALLSKQNTIQQLSISSRNKTIGIIAGLFLLSGIFAALFYNRNQLKQKAILQAQMLQQQDILTRAIVEAEENERKRIAGDLHDGVGQLFSAVKMNLSGLFDRIKMERKEDIFLAENTMALVDESCREVRSISHEMMPNMLLHSGIVADLRSFIEKIDGDRLHVTLESNGFKNKLESNAETMLYRIIQESINNVIKHAKASSLAITLNRNPTGMTAQIKDNGIGFDTGKMESFTGIGLKNVATRVAYLKGTVTYHSVPGVGTTVTIKVPV